MEAGPPLRDIVCFAHVARRLSFSGAAVELGLSQPAVSQAIARLERTLGVRLFDRSSRDVQLSDAGKSLLPFAEALIGQAAAFTAEAARLAVPDGPTIRLAYDPLVGGFAARIARRSASRGIEVDLRPAGWSTATADLAQGIASAALMTTPFPAGLASTARFQVPVTHLAVPAGSPLATAARLRLDQVRRFPVLLPRVRPPGGVWARLATRLPPRAVAGPPAAGDDLDDPAAALDLVAAGRGVLPVPGLLVATTRRPDVRFVPLDAGDLSMSFGLVWRPERAPADLMTLVQTVQTLLRTT